MENLIQDLRFAVRTLRKSPAFLLVTALTLALGIGANVAIFTLVNTVLLQPLPFHEPDRLVRVFDDLNGASAKDVGISVPELLDLSDRFGVFANLCAMAPASTALSGGDRVERIEMLGTSPNYFEVLGAKAALGRVYTQADWVPGFVDGVVISDALWKRQFGGDPHVIGRRIRVDEDGYTIIGVMAPEFRHPGPTLARDVELWASAGLVAPPFPTPPVRNLRILRSAMGRLKPGVTLAQAQQQLNAFVAQMQQAYPADYPKQQRWAVRIERVQSSLTGNVRPTLVILLAAATLVLLIVCVNIASLLIARSSARMREFAIRQALGASRMRLVRQLLTESLLISLVGGLAAVLVLRLSLKSLLALMPADVPRLTEVHADWRMAAIALAVSIITGALFGLTPALHASATDPNRDLKEGGWSSGGSSVRQNRSRVALVVMEVALSVVLLISAGLLIRSFSTVIQQQPGFDAKGLTVGQIWIPIPNNPQVNQYLKSEQRAVLARQLLRQFDALPDMQIVALGTSPNIPFLTNGSTPLPFSLPDEYSTQQNDHAAEFGAVSPLWFAALKIPLQQGRVFTDEDSELAQKVVVVNEAFARAFSRQKDVIGRCLRDSAGREFEIVGVVGDVRDQALDLPARPRIYASIFQVSNMSLAVFLRTHSDVTAIRDMLAESVHRVDAELPVFGVRPMEDIMSTSMARRRFSVVLMSIFAALALFLAALGIYGVMAFVVGQRFQEFGIRRALGAQPRDILFLALRPGLILTCTGIIVGLAASIAVTHLMSSLLFRVSASDALTFATVPTVLAIVAVSACLIPATRATRISPAQSLRF